VNDEYNEVCVTVVVWFG